MCNIVLAMVLVEAYTANQRIIQAQQAKNKKSQTNSRMKVREGANRWIARYNAEDRRTSKMIMPLGGSAVSKTIEFREKEV